MKASTDKKMDGGSDVQKAPEHRKNSDELTFKLATTTTTSESTSTVLSTDTSAEAIKKILNGDRVVSSSTTPAPSPAKAVKPTPTKAPADAASPFKISSALTSGAHVERVKLFPRSMPTESPSKPKKIIDFSGSNQVSMLLNFLPP